MRILFPFILLMFVSCNARYGYLNKVKVKTNKSERSKTEGTKAEKQETTETLNETIDDNVIAGFDTTQKMVVIAQKPWEIKEKSNTPKETKEQARKDKKKNVRKKKPKEGENYYAYWAFVLTIICLAGFILVIPIALAPLIFTLSVIALIQIKKTGEKGKKKAIFTLIFGLVVTVGALAFIIWGGTLLMASLIFGIVLLFDLFWFILIRLSSKNPDNKVDSKTLKPLSRSTKKYVIKAFIYGCLTGALGAVIIGFIFGLPAFRNAILALKGIQKEKRSLRFIMYFIMLIGVLGAIGLLVTGILLSLGLFPYDAIYVLVILLVGLFVAMATAIITLIYNT